MIGGARLVIAIVAVLAAMGVLFVLITPVPDELPSTGPHVANTIFAFVLVSFYSPSDIVSAAQPEAGLTLPLSCVDRLSLTCTRLR